MTPATTAQTRRNIARFCEIHGIPQDLEFSDESMHNQDRSRVAAFDQHGLLLRHIGDNRDKWTVDSGQNHNAHGWKVQASYRSKSRPSLQVCVVPARGGQYSEMLLIDLDEANPFIDFPEHLWECLRNMGPRTTDPAKIAAMLG